MESLTSIGGERGREAATRGGDEGNAGKQMSIWLSGAANLRGFTRSKDRKRTYIAARTARKSSLNPLQEANAVFPQTHSPPPCLPTSAARDCLNHDITLG